MRNNGLLGQPQTSLFAGRSPIKHVIYLIKENRTYDQVFGDLEKSGDGSKADGDPSLAIFGEVNAAARPTKTKQNITPIITPWRSVSACLTASLSMPKPAPTVTTGRLLRFQPTTWTRHFVGTTAAGDALTTLKDSIVFQTTSRYEVHHRFSARMLLLKKSPTTCAGSFRISMVHATW